MTSWAGPHPPRQQAALWRPNGHPQLGTSPTPVPFPDTMRAKETESHKGEVAGPGPREQWPWSPGSWLGHLQGLPRGIWAGPRQAVLPLSASTVSLSWVSTPGRLFPPLFGHRPPSGPSRGGRSCPNLASGLSALSEGTRGPAGGSHPPPGTRRHLQGGSSWQGDSGAGGQPQPSAPAVCLHGRTLLGVEGRGLVASRGLWQLGGQLLEATLGLGP